MHFFEKKRVILFFVKIDQIEGTKKRDSANFQH